MLWARKWGLPVVQPLAMGGNTTEVAAGGGLLSHIRGLVGTEGAVVRLTKTPGAVS